MADSGIDQILPYPSHSNVYEPAVSDASEYAQLAEEKTARFLSQI